MSYKISDFLKQDKNSLITLKDCKLEIDMSNYNEGENYYYKIDTKTLWFKNLISVAHYDEVEFDLILDYSIELQDPKAYEKNEDTILLSYVKDQVVLDVSTETLAIEKQANYLTRLLGGREISKDVEHTYRQVSNIYFPLDKNLEQVHIEILLSNVYRDKDSPQYPARLSEHWNPVMMNIKNIVFSSSALQGLAFENVNKAITTGLVEENNVNPSILEQVFTGEIK